MLRSLGNGAFRGLLLLPLVAGLLGLVLFGLVPILVIGLVLFLPAALPFLAVCLAMLATESGGGGR